MASFPPRGRAEGRKEGRSVFVVVCVLVDAGVGVGVGVDDDDGDVDCLVGWWVGWIDSIRFDSV